MKKTLPYILMVLMFANMFAPLSIGVDNTNRPIIKTTKAEAGGIVLNTTVLRKNDTTITVQVDVTFSGGTGLTSQEHIEAFIKDQGLTKTILSQGVTLTNAVNQGNGNGTTQTGTVVFSGLTPNTTYNVSAYALQTSKSVWSAIGDIAGIVSAPDVSITSKPNPEYISVTTSAPGATQNTSINIKQSSDSTTAADIMPACSMNPFWSGGGTVVGCVAQLIYYVLFVPTSYVFALTGKFFDFTFAYSVNDQSYRSDFVVQGWGVVRDFCNMFFIFVLLYVAFATILNLHGFKTKETIVNIVIIGLFINFSLFTAQVVIDASNIMARVFYNDKAIVVGDATDPATGRIIGRPGTNNEIQLSAAIVNKIDPQKLILQATKINDIKDTGGQGTQNGVTTGTFILITLLAVVVNIVGMMVFLSVGLIFVTRVIGLWFSMIFAPLAFFTYTVPAMQGWGMVGWRKWWPELLKMAFLAPVFIFFLYLIIKFLNTGLGLIEAGNDSGVGFVLKIVIPFIFIMVLLMKAKSIAKDMSGSLGESITNGIASVGGIALGAATGGAAFLGKGTIGRLAANIDKKDWLNDAAAGKTGNRFTQTFAKLGKRATTYTSGASFDARQTGAANTFSKQTGMNLNNGALGAVGLGTKQNLGGYAGAQKRKKEKEDKFGETLGHSHHDQQTIEEGIEKRKGEIAGKEIDVSDKKAASDEARATAEQLRAIAKDAQRKADTAKGAAKTALLAAAETATQVATNAEADATAKRKDYAEEQRKLSALKIGDAQTKGLSAMEKDLERNKTGRQTEYALTVKRKSGRIHQIDSYQNTDDYKNADEAGKKKIADQYRDDYGNIKKYGHTDAASAQGFKAAMLEVAQGAAKGAAAGTIVAPGLGTAIGGLAGAIRGIMQHNGATNISVGVKETHAGSHDTKDSYKAPTVSASAPKHDDHAAPSGGGGAHH